MSHQKNAYNDKSSDEDSISESEYLASIMSLLNGHCKINFVVPQISSFCTSDSLLPINAKVNNSTLNNKDYNEIHNAPTPDSITNMLKNVIHLKSDENNEDLDDKQLHSFDNKPDDEFQVYSKPSYSDNSNMGKNEDKKICMSPRTKKKKNKIINMASTSENQTIIPSTHVKKEQNVSIGYIDPYEIARLNDGLHFKQEQELQNKQMKNVKNNINITNTNLSRSQTPHLKNPESEIQYDSTPLVSQCPLCFGLYPTSDIEAHASECSI